MKYYISHSALYIYVRPPEGPIKWYSIGEKGQLAITSSPADVSAVLALYTHSIVASYVRLAYPKCLILLPKEDNP